jgi:ABC-2 type transport system permease protein
MALKALMRGRARAFMNTGQLVRRQSWLKIAVITFFGTGLLIGLSVLFFEGFRFLHNLGGAGLMVIHRLFALFFFGLGVMLTFSSIVTTYATFYRSPEVPALLTRPIPIGELSLYKMIESAVFSSWAFFFMILPFVGAFALHQRLSPLFAIWTLMFSIPFVLLFAAVGTIICLLLVRWLPTGRSLFILLAGLAAVCVALLLRTLWTPLATQDEGSLVLTRLIPGMRVSSHPLLPSWWISEGIMALARGDHLRGGMLWLLMVANVLAAGSLVEWLGRKVFYEGWLKVVAGGRSRAGAPFAWNGARHFLIGAAPDTRALLMKDIRLFLRDPVQYTQALVFFGLLALYFLNLRQLNYHLLPSQWRNLIVFLNMFSVSAVICSLSSRFVYPQMSLEGHSFWMTGLTPLGMKRILRAKFLLSAGVLAVVAAVLVGLSSSMLRVDRTLSLVSVAMALSVCLVVAALSLGLGAVFMDPKERNPAVIVSSFGGTLNLVIGMGYTIAVMVVFAGLFHLRGTGYFSETGFQRAAILGAAGLVVATIAGVVIPLRMGRARMERQDF